MTPRHPGRAVCTVPGVARGSAVPLPSVRTDGRPRGPLQVPASLARSLRAARAAAEPRRVLHPASAPTSSFFPRFVFAVSTACPCAVQYRSHVRLFKLIKVRFKILPSVTLTAFQMLGNHTFQTKQIIARFHHCRKFNETMLA